MALALRERAGTPYLTATSNQGSGSILHHGSALVSLHSYSIVELQNYTMLRSTVGSTYSLSVTTASTYQQ